MEKSAVYHLGDSIYSYPVSPTTARIRLRTKRDDTIKQINIIWNTQHKFWAERLSTPMEIKYTDSLFDYYQADLDNGMPGYTYLFEIIETDGSVWYYNESGFDTKMYLTTTFEDNFMVVFPNENDLVYPNKAFDGRIFYQIFPERFARGEHSTIDKSYITMDWNTEEPRNDLFAGGDLVGITEKLPYLKEMGIGAIYLNPIHPSISAHKYDIDDYFDVDKMFGSLADLKTLVDTAHAMDIKIVMDLVFNHSSYYNPIFQDVVKNGKNSKYYDWYFVYGDKPVYEKCNYNTFCEVPMMPKLNTNNPKVQQYLASIGEFYARDYGIDGFRLDVAFDVSHDFWRYFRKKLLAINPDIYIVGEFWQNSHSFLGADQWDSTMNYPLQYGCKRYLVSNRYNASQLADFLNSALMRYKDATNQNMLNLLDSHDTPRFFTMVGEDVNLYLMGIAILMFYKGSPMIYYGTEILMNGEQDPYNRKCMRWDSPMYNSDEHKVILQLLSLRANSDVLKFGDIAVYSKDDLFYITRTFEGQSITLAVNNSAENKVVSGISYGYNIDGDVMLPKSFAIIK